MLSVSLDSNGWTVVTPSADTQTIYVSSSDGKDTNNGLSPQTPIKSFAKAEALVRTGMPDWVLLKSGDTFNDAFLSWTASGRSVNEPMLISHYGTGALPLINTGSALYAFATPSSPTKPVNYIDIIGLQFHNNNRDPNSPTFNSRATGGGTRI